MATLKPISTISYNTEAFLKEKLEQWLKAHLISAYLYICHKGEDGDKDHIHLRIEPNRKLDPMDLSEELKEYVLGSEKPLGCRTWRPAKEEDWILYALHDKAYLNAKYGGGEQGEKLPYQKTDLICNEDYNLDIAYIRARAYLKHSASGTLERLKQGEKPTNLIGEGVNPFQVNAVLRTLTDKGSTFIHDLVQERDTWRHRFEVLANELSRLGYDTLIDEDGVISLTEKKPPKKDTIEDIIKRWNKPTH